MEYKALNFEDKPGLFDDHQAPRLIAEMNHQFKPVELAGDFVWHNHAQTNATFVALEGEQRIEFHDGHVDLKAVEMSVVSKGAAHQSHAVGESTVRNDVGN